jgi:lipoyl(octanoyl) transferase
MKLLQLGVCDYQSVYDQMRSFNDERQADTDDELWFLQHQPVFTNGQAGKAEHLIATGDIPVVQTDRGGQVTYHGPGQLVVYLMLDIKRMGWGPRRLVTAIEQAIVDTLQYWDIEAAPRADAPGVYVAERKIASLGLRISRGRTLHGLALNVDMDLEPFQRINPCGYAGMQMSDMKREIRSDIAVEAVQERLQVELLKQLQNSD